MNNQLWNVICDNLLVSRNCVNRAKNMNPLCAVLFLIRRSGVTHKGVICMHRLLELGVTPMGMDLALLRRAFRDRRCRSSLDVLLQTGKLCSVFPSECLSIYLQDGHVDVVFAAALAKEMDNQDALALAWVLAGLLPDDILHTIATNAFALHGMRYANRVHYSPSLKRDSTAICSRDGKDSPYFLSCDLIDR